MNARRRWPLSRRLLSVITTLVLIAALAIALVSTIALRSTLMSQLDQRLVASVERSQSSMPGSPGGPGAPNADERPPALQAPGLLDVGTISLLSVTDHSLGVSLIYAGYFDAEGEFRGLSPDQINVLRTNASQATNPLTVEIPELGSYRMIASTTDSGVTVVTAMEMSSLQLTLDKFVGAVLAVLVGAVVLAAGLGWLLIRRELRELRTVAQTAAAVSELPLDRGKVQITARVPVNPGAQHTEVGQLATALNTLLGHVENSLEAREHTASELRAFVADASHELRTPLAAIQGHAELIRRFPEGINADALNSVSRIEDEAKRMGYLVNDLLLLARLDRSPELELTEVDLVPLLVDTLADAHAADRSKSWQLELPEQDPAPELLARGEEARLRQILTNLLANARVHTPAGTSVTLRARLAQTGGVVIEVHDDGPGIPPELQDRVFDRFARADVSRNRAGGSTGLGLAIARGLAEAQGGSLTVTSQPGDTTFTLILGS